MLEAFKPQKSRKADAVAILIFLLFIGGLCYWDQVGHKSSELNLTAPMFVTNAQIDKIAGNDLSYGHSLSNKTILVIFEVGANNALVLGTYDLTYGHPEDVPDISYLDSGGAFDFMVPPRHPRGGGGIIYSRDVPACDLVWMTGDQAKELRIRCLDDSLKSGFSVGAEILNRTAAGLTVRLKSEATGVYRGSAFLITDEGVVLNADLSSPSTRLSAYEALMKEHYGPPNYIEQYRNILGNGKG